MEKQRGALRLAALDAAAAQLGLRPGMALAEARACVPALAVAHVAPDKDEQTLLFCAEAATRFTPLAATDGADGLLLDITGCAHLFGGEAGLLDAARGLMIRFGLTARAAIAGTPEAAHALARFTPGAIVPPGEERGVARPLPVAALEAGAEITVALGRAGLRTLGDLDDRPPHTLTARFGAGLTTKLRRLLGHEDRRITPLRASPAMMAAQIFPEPLLLKDSLVAALDRLAQDVAGQLEARGEGGRAFEAAFFRTDGIVRRVVVETAQATREAARLMRLFHLRIEALADPVDPGFGFDAVWLGILRSEPMALRQGDLAGGQETNEALAVAALMDRLVARFGRESVLRFVARDTHDPGRASAIVPYLSSRSSAPWPDPLDGTALARPLTLFARPHPIEAMAEVPDGPPIRFRWRRLSHDVTRAEGPERISPEWWLMGESLPATRDYYRVEDSRGHRFWLFREGFYEGASEHPRWFLHGLFA